MEIPIGALIGSTGWSQLGILALMLGIAFGFFGYGDGGGDGGD